MGALFFSVSAFANGNVHVSRFWHNHQPIYWPEWNSNGGQNSRVQYAWDSIVLKSGQNYGGISPSQHPENNLTDIFGLDDRRQAYQGGPAGSLSTFSGGGFAISYSGSLIDNVRQLGAGGNLGYSGNWNSGNTSARSSGRLDLVGFTYHHSLAPLLPKEVFRKELQIFKQAWWKAWGGNSDLSDHSKGYFPTEMAFSEELIDVLVDEGYEWSIVASHHLSRTAPTYFNYANPTGTWNIFSSPPNKADLLGPSPTSGWWYSEPNPGNAAWNVSPYAYQLHKAQYVNPNSGSTKQMYLVPSDDVLSYRFGYANEGIGKIQSFISPYATDASRPVIVMPSSDGDNAWGGGNSSWFEATPQFFNDAAGAGYVKNTPQGFVNAAKSNAQLVHVEDGAWIFPEMDYGSPNFLKWIEPPVNPKNIASCYPNTMVDLETPGFALKFFSYAPLMAGANWVITAEQILKDEGGSVASWKVATPYDWDGSWTSPNDVELAWHIYLTGLDSGFNYYGGLGNDDEVKPALATKRAIDKLQSFMSTRMHKDATGPTLLRPQRFPYNPGAYTFGWYNRVPGKDERFLKKMPSEFYVWTHAYDVNGITNISVKVRIDNDGVNSLGTTDNETYAGGPDVGSWITLPMTKRVLPKTRAALNAAADNGQIDYFVFDSAFWADPVIADYYFVQITEANVPNFKEKLLDYYIEAYDGRGNVSRSEIQHVYVGESEVGPPAQVPSATFSANPSDCAPITVNFNAATSVLASASTVYVAYHFSTNTNDWASAAMTRTGSNTFTYTFSTNVIPDNAPQLEVAFNDGVNWANNNGNNWKTSIRDCDAPTGPSDVAFNPAAPNGCDPVTIRYYPNEGPLKSASTIKIHIGRNGWQDVIDPDPAMTKNGHYWEYTYVVPTNTTVIDVVFSDGSGVWDNHGGADWHVAVTNCGTPPAPVGPVSVSAAAACEPVTITYNPAGRALQGASDVYIHIGRNGWQDVILPNPKMTKSGANWTYSYQPLPGSTNIDIVFNDGGGVWDNNGGSDWHFAIAECADIPTGLAITNPATETVTVPYSTTSIDLKGIADGMTGHLHWTNKLTGAAGSLAAVSPWTVSGVALGVGGNEIVIKGSNVVAGGVVTNARDSATDTAYSSGWNSGNNGGSGFLGWQLTADAGNSGHFVQNAMWGMWSHEGGHLAESLRPFQSALTTGQTFRVFMKNGWIWESGGSVGIALRDNSGNTMWQLYFNGGDAKYNLSTGVTDIGWTDAGLDVAFTVTSPGNYSVDVTPVGGSNRTYTGVFTNAITEFRAWSYNNGTSDGQNSNRDYYINNLKITSFGEGGSVDHSDFVIVTRQNDTTVPPTVAGMILQLSGNSATLSLTSSIPGAAYAIWSSPTLFPSQNWQKVGNQVLGNGGPVDLLYTNGLLPLEFLRIGVETP